jgi:hypothetical protein
MLKKSTFKKTLKKPKETEQSTSIPAVIVLNGVERPHDHEFQWYSTKQACNLLRNRTIHMVGDSTSRRLAYTLRALLVGWPVEIGKA